MIDSIYGRCTHDTSNQTLTGRMKNSEKMLGWKGSLPRKRKCFNVVPRVFVWAVVFVVSFNAAHGLGGDWLGSMEVQAGSIWESQMTCCAALLDLRKHNLEREGPLNRGHRIAVPSEVAHRSSQERPTAEPQTQLETSPTASTSPNTAEMAVSTMGIVSDRPFADNEPFSVEDSNAYVYTVRMSEYWILIAGKFGITFDALRNANPDLWQLRGEKIRPGDQMLIPGLNVQDRIPSIVYTTVTGDSWHQIADRFSVPFLHLLRDNLDLWERRGIYIQPGDEMTITYLPSMFEILVTQLGPTKTYIVRPGDSWFSIAATFDLTLNALQAINRPLWELRGQNIWPDDEMVIPLYDVPQWLESRAIDPLEEGQKEEEFSIPAGMYEVQPGDTWELVAETVDINVQALKDVNPALAERALQPGDIVRISWILHLSISARQGQSQQIRDAATLDNLPEGERTALTERGMAVYKEQYCGICHQLDSAGTRGQFGPSHNGMGALAAARLNDPKYRGTATDIYAYLYESIIKPEAYYVENFAMSTHPMPSYQHIPRDDLEALIVFLADQ